MTDTLRLAPLETASRLDRLVDLLDGADYEALLVSGRANVRYLTGFTGSAGLLVVTAGASTLVTDGRYGDQAADQTAASGVDVNVVVGAGMSEQDRLVDEALGGAAVVGLEDHLVTWSTQMRYAADLGAELVPAGEVVEMLRRVKDPGEIDRVRAACAIADEAFSEVLPMLTERATEREVALALEFAMRRRGASGVSFDPIVASGPNAAMPHARPSARRIEAGEMVVMDFGCVVEGYCSDMTRTVSVGAPSPAAAEIWQVVEQAQAAGRAEVAAGVACGDVDAACRTLIEEAGFGRHFTHSTGHGVGLEIHEQPWVRARSDGTLGVGDIVTVEPGIYVSGVGGVRLEDTLVITEDGAESLTLSPKEMVL